MREGKESWLKSTERLASCSLQTNHFPFYGQEHCRSHRDILEIMVKFTDSEKSHSGRDPGGHLIQILHFIDEETKA